MFTHSGLWKKLWHDRNNNNNKEMFPHTVRNILSCSLYPTEYSASLWSLFQLAGQSAKWQHEEEKIVWYARGMWWSAWAILDMKHTLKCQRNNNGTRATVIHVKRNTRSSVSHRKLDSLYLPPVWPPKHVVSTLVCYLSSNIFKF